MKLIVFDIEVLLNCFIVCFYDTKTREKYHYEISDRVNQLREIVVAFTKGDAYFTGYNCISYDSTICAHLVKNFARLDKCTHTEICNECFMISDDIINHESSTCRHLRWTETFKQVDLLTMLFSKALRVGLKELEITMCFHNVQEMGHHWSLPIPENRIDELIAYCYNDVNATARLLSLCVNDLQLRREIGKQFKIECLSKDGVAIGVDIFTKFICEEMEINKNELFAMVDTPEVIHVSDLVLPVIQFKTKKFQEVLRWFKSIVISTTDAMNEVDGELTDEKKKYKKKVLLNKTVHTFALGGIHSENKPAIYESKDGYTIDDEDVASYYPQLIIEWGIAPRAIRTHFLKVYGNIKQLRLEAKKVKDKPKDLTYKLAMNSISGNYKNKYSSFYSPDSSISMCVNGQLMLAMLIEECELAGIRCLASNTDGATFHVHDTQQVEFTGIKEKWQATTKMVLEQTIYEKFVVYAVNDYIAFKKGYSDIKDQLHFHSPKESIKLNEVPVTLLTDPTSQLRESYVKEKGMFITSPRIGKGLDMLITAKAVQNYFGRGIPVEQTVRECENIWDFIKFQKVGKQFECVWNEQEQQRVNRFYVSKKGAYLYKTQMVEKHDKKKNIKYNVKTMEHMLKGYGVILMNKAIEQPMQEYKLDYSYYIGVANELIHAIDPKQNLLF